MSEINGPPMTLDPAGAMARLIERVEHIDRAVSRLERLADEAGLDHGVRLGRALELLGRLADGPASRAVAALLERPDDLEKLAGLLLQSPGAIARLVDAYNAWAARMAAREVDVAKALENGLDAALWLGQQISARELERFGMFLRSEVLEPNALAVIGKTGRALAASHADSHTTPTPERLGVVGLLRALRDPDVQRALSFAVRVAKRFGAHLADPADVPTRPMETTFPDRP
jgi:hypothetical protein